jgi:hypothetical protein
MCVNICVSSFEKCYSGILPIFKFFCHCVVWVPFYILDI